MNHLSIYSLCAGLILTVGCGPSMETVVNQAAQSAGTAAQNRPSSTETSSIAPVDQKIVKHGELQFQTTDRVQTDQFIQSAIRETGAYIANDNEILFEKRIQRCLVLRVPADQFDRLVALISAEQSTFDTRRIVAEDVTEQFTDLNSRVNVKKATEQRLLQLLTNAENVEDVLKIENQVSQLREKIEVEEGRLRYLQNRIRYSTLSVTFYQTRTDTAPLFLTRLVESVDVGWNAMLSLIVALAVLWPALVIAATAFIVRRRRQSVTA